MYCDICEEKIENGYGYFDFDGFIVCEDCIDEYLKENRHDYFDNDLLHEAEKEVQEFIEGIER